MVFVSILDVILELLNNSMKLDMKCMLWIIEVDFSTLQQIGHGQSDGYRNYLKSMDNVIQDQCDFVESIHQKRPSIPIFIMVKLCLSIHE